MGRMRGLVERPEGLRYVEALLSVDEEAGLVERLRGLDYGEVRMHGQAARRVVHHFGLSYAFDSGALTPGDPVPGWAEPLRERCAALLRRPPEDLTEVLATRYPRGATIGWHRDAPAFGEVVGVSLGAPCVMRFQRGSGSERRVFEQPLEPRSAYVLAGRSRTVWQHSIPAVPDERFSLTFRTVRAGWLARSSPTGSSPADAEASVATGSDADTGPDSRA